MVAYAFPPAGGVSVQRITKFIKFLPEFNWSTSVLTVENPSVPTFDETLVSEIPANTIIRRAHTLEPGYQIKSAVGANKETNNRQQPSKFKSAIRNTLRRTANLILQPDSQILWRPFALREGKKLLDEIPHDAIFATGPPFSSMLLGMTLAKQRNLPLVLDFRDEWAFMTYWENKQFGRIENAVQRRMQARVLKAADLVLATTPATAVELRRLVAEAGGNATVVSIYNGFDPTDFPMPTELGVRKDYGAGIGLFRLSFVGTLWNVTPISHVVDAIIALCKKAPELAEKLELVIAGRRTKQQETELDRLLEMPIKLVRLPFMQHKEAIHLMCQSNALLLINADLPNTDRLINAKSFEYMATRRPIFVVAPHGELWRLLGELPGALLARPGDVDAITKNLITAIKRWQQGIEHDCDDWNLEPYTRRYLTSKLADHLNVLIAERSN